MLERTVLIRPGTTGVDFAAWRPATAAGLGVYVLRYGSRSTWKNMTATEVATYHAWGIAVVGTWEQAADSWTKGATLGRDHGKAAAAFWAALGYPKGLPIPMAYDTNVPSIAAATDPRATAAQRADAIRLRQAARDYGDAAADELEAAGYLLGIYGDLDVILLLQDRSHLNWLAGATSWSDPTAPYQPETMPGYELVHIRQRISGSTPNYDANVTVREFTAWLPHNEPDHIETPPTPPAPVLLEEDPDMHAFTHSDTDHDGHPPRWTFWVLMPDGTKRHLSGIELDGILKQRDSAPALPIADIDQINDWAPPVTSPATGNVTKYVGSIELTAADGK